MKNNVRRITDGAVISAIMGLVMVIDGSSGMLLDGLLFWIMPIPILIYTVKYDFGSGLMVSVATTLMAFIITLPHLAILVGFSNLIGLAYGIGANKKWKTSRILLLTFIVTFMYYVISMILLAGFFGYDAVAELKAIIEFLSSFFKDLGTQEEIIKLLTLVNPFFKMLITFPFFLPSIIAVLQTIITHMVSIILLRRLKLAELKSKPIFGITISKKTGLILVIGLILTYVYLFSVNSSFDNVIILVQFIIQLVFIVMGALLSLTYVAVKRQPILSILVGLLIIGMPLLIMGIGFIDVFTDTRINMIRRTMNERESRTA